MMFPKLSKILYIGGFQTKTMDTTIYSTYYLPILLEKCLKFKSNWFNLYNRRFRGPIILISFIQGPLFITILQMVFVFVKGIW